MSNGIRQQLAIERLRAAHERDIEHYRAKEARYLEALRGQNEQMSVLLNGNLQFALTGIRSLVLLNGGGVLAVLTFLGHLLSSEDHARRAAAGHFGDVIWWFMIGAGFGLGTALMSYLSQSLINEIPRLPNGRHKWWVEATRAIAILIGASGLVAFGYGCLEAADAFDLATRTPKG